VVRVVGAAALGLVAVAGIVRTVRASPAGSEVQLGPRAGPARPAVTFARFVALTAVNPLTALAFVALAAGLASRWPTADAAAAFVVGVAAGSLAWQLGLVGAGAVLGRWTARTGERARRVLALVGFGGVAVLAGLLAAG